MRKLASIQKIKNIFEIPGAEYIEGIEVLGWKLVAKKGEFKIGDNCVYFEVDSIVPDKPCFSFLKNKFRLKCQRFLMQISQGLALPFDKLYPDFPQFKELIDSTSSEEELIDMEVTDILEVIKWEPQLQDTGVMVNGKKSQSSSLGNFPNWIAKTDETRIQAVPVLLEYIKNIPLYISMKMDGSSMTVFLKDEEFGVCSRNQQKRENELCHFWHTARVSDLEAKLRKAYSNTGIAYALQGELCGPGVQENLLKLTEFKFFCFNVYDIKANKYLDYEDLISFCNEYDIQHVPIINNNFIINDSTTVDDLVNLSMLKYDSSGKDAEGIVVRSKKENWIYIPKKWNNRISFKVINPLYLLKQK